MTIVFHVYDSLFSLFTFHNLILYLDLSEHVPGFQFNYENGQKIEKHIFLLLRLFIHFSYPSLLHMGLILGSKSLESSLQGLSKNPK